MSGRADAQDQLSVRKRRKSLKSLYACHHLNDGAFFGNGASFLLPPEAAEVNMLVLVILVMVTAQIAAITGVVIKGCGK